MLKPYPAGAVATVGYGTCATLADRPVLLPSGDEPKPYAEFRDDRMMVETSTSAFGMMYVTKPRALVCQSSSLWQELAVLKMPAENPVNPAFPDVRKPFCISGTFAVTAQLS